jgi:hypothetical protein
MVCWLSSDMLPSSAWQPARAKKLADRGQFPRETGQWLQPNSTRLAVLGALQLGMDSAPSQASWKGAETTQKL